MATKTHVPLESSIVKRIMAYLRSIPGCHAEKRHGGPYGRAGEPDISGCLRGIRFEMEVKRPGQKPTKLQEAAMRRWAEAGAVVAVVHSLEEAQAVIHEVLRRAGEWQG